MSESQPILDMPYQKPSMWKLQLLPKYPMSDAVGYTFERWKKLTMFATAGPQPRRRAD